MSKWPIVLILFASLFISCIQRPTPKVLGHSLQGRAIELYTFGNGPKRIALIGGIHGGFEWNTILLAYTLVDHFTAHPQEIPQNVTLSIIPSANPDGQAVVTGKSGRFLPSQVNDQTVAGRFNANQVDLNRNWECRWREQAVWLNQEVSGGTKPLSEVETQLLATFLTQPPVDLAVFWHSSANSVYAGGCNGHFLAADALGQAYAKAAGYPFNDLFTGYEVTGDATDWLSLQGIPAITVELRTQDTTEQEANLAGVRAVLALLGE